MCVIWYACSYHMVFWKCITQCSWNHFFYLLWQELNKRIHKFKNNVSNQLSVMIKAWHETKIKCHRSENSRSHLLQSQTYHTRPAVSCHFKRKQNDQVVCKARPHELGSQLCLIRPQELKPSGIMLFFQKDIPICQEGMPDGHVSWPCDHMVLYKTEIPTHMASHHRPWCHVVLKRKSNACVVWGHTP